MPIIPLTEVSKFVRFGSPYTSATFSCQQDKIHCRQGPLCGFEVEEVGGNLVVQPGRVLIKGIAVEILVEQTLALPAFPEPYILYLHTADEIDASVVILDFTDKTGLDASRDPITGEPAFVPIAEKTTNLAWRTLPYISEDFIVANTQGGVRHRTTHIMAGTETTVEVEQPLGIHTQTTDTLLVFKDGVIQKEGPDWAANGMKGITLPGVAGAGEIYHLFMSDDIEWIEEIVVGAPGNAAVTLPYNPGHHDLWIFEVGVGKQRLVDHYTEIDANTVNFVNAGTYALVKFKHMFWRERISLSGVTTDQDFLNVYDGARADIAVFHATSSAASGILLNQGSTHDYNEKSGESVELLTNELYAGGAAAEVVEVYRLRTGIPKGIGFIMAEGFQLGGGGGAGLGMFYRSLPLTTGPEIFPNGDAGERGAVLYTPGNDSLRVFMNGQQLSIDAGDYTEDVGGLIFTVNRPLTVGSTGIIAWVPIGGNAPGPTNDIFVEDEGTTVAGGPHSILNFAGAGVNAINSGAGRTTITIPGTVASTDELVKVNAIDATPEFLEDKITGVGGINVTTVGGATKQLQIDGSSIGGIQDSELVLLAPTALGTLSNTGTPNVTGNFNFSAAVLAGDTAVGVLVSYEAIVTANDPFPQAFTLSDSTNTAILAGDTVDLLGHTTAGSFITKSAGSVVTIKLREGSFGNGTFIVNLTLLGYWTTT